MKRHRGSVQLVAVCLEGLDPDYHKNSPEKECVMDETETRQCLSLEFPYTIFSYKVRHEKICFRGFQKGKPQKDWIFYYACAAKKEPA